MFLSVRFPRSINGIEIFKFRDCGEAIYRKKIYTGTRRGGIQKETKSLSLRGS